MFKAVFVSVLLFLPYNVLSDDKPTKYLISELRVSVSLSSDEIIQSEPVVLKVSIRNVSHKSQKLYRALDPKWQYLKIFVIDPDGKRHEIKTSRVADGKAEYMELPTFVNRKGVVGTGVHHRILLTPYPGGWLDTPGKYQVGAIFNYAEGKRTSSSAATLTVKPAEGVNKEALERFRGFPQAKFLAKETTCPEIVGEFEAVIREYPESVYVPWCYYILGRAHQDRQGGHAKSDATNARMHYKSLLKKFPDFPLKVEVEYEMARELFRLEKTDESLYEVKRLIKLDPLADNYDGELFLFYEARRALDEAGDAITAEDLPRH